MILCTLLLGSAIAHGADAARGQSLYAANCTACHGATGNGKGPAAVALTPKPTDFTAAGWTASRSDTDLAAAIRAGRPGTSMTPYTRLTDAEVVDLVAYVRTLAPAAP
jgi:mono/diheme cytochrome c family protein